jgi:S1-C subfamily serine protease
VRGLGRSSDNAVLITEVQSDGPAARAGIVNGDILIEFDGEPLHGLDHLHRLLSGDRAHKEILVRVLRRGTLIDVSLRPDSG